MRRQGLKVPTIGLLLGNVDFTNLFMILKEGTVAEPFASPTEAQKAGVATINYGVFINTIISFIIVAFAIFIVVRNINKLKREEGAPAEEPTTKECPQFFSTIPIKATCCALCTSEL